MRRGFTLIELLIAVGLLLFAGMAVAWMVSSAVRTWRRGDRLFRVQVKARRIMRYLERDLQMLFVGPLERYGRTVTPRLLCDFDPSLGTQRLRLIRTFPLEENPLAQEAGSLLLPRGRIDGINDSVEALRGDLLPTGGLCEVAWLHTGSNSRQPFRLYRAVVSPPGGRNSLFRNARLDERFVEVADGVLIFGLQFWSSVTNTWEQFEPRWNAPKSGPLLWWDSTRAAPDPFQLSKEAYRIADRPESADEPEDDIYPLCVRVVVVMAERGGGAVTRLARSVGEDAGSIYVEDPKPLRGRKYVLVDGEVMEVRRIEGRRVLLKARGLFGSEPAAHRRGTPVRTGVHFVRVIPLPCGVEDWAAPK